MWQRGNLANVPITPVAKGGEKYRYLGFSDGKKDTSEPIERHMGGLPGEGSEAPKPDVPSDHGQDDPAGGADASGGAENQSLAGPRTIATRNSPNKFIQSLTVAGISIRSNLRQRGTCPWGRCRQGRNL